ncbi:hypothetical protein C8R47DRAFT_1080573 [Mycena vitilis]|nr:hypothetical protein C8R47DRAFT_1080573 [Mycena vitilis]
MYSWEQEHGDMEDPEQVTAMTIAINRAIEGFRIRHPPLPNSRTLTGSMSWVGTRGVATTWCLYYHLARPLQRSTPFTARPVSPREMHRPRLIHDSATTQTPDESTQTPRLQTQNEDFVSHGARRPTVWVISGLDSERELTIQEFIALSRLVPYEYSRWLCCSPKVVEHSLGSGRPHPEQERGLKWNIQAATSGQPHLWSATFLLSPFGENSSLEPTRIEVPALRRLYLRSIGWDGVNSLQYRLNLPALKWYGHQSGHSGKGYSQGGLMNLLKASTIRLNSLRLHLRNIRGFLGHELTEILRDQHTLTRLELTGCRGSFWQALETGHFLVPHLTEFTFTDFTELHLSALICFVNVRCPGATHASSETPSLPRHKLREPCALEILNLTPKFPLTDHGEPCPSGSPGNRIQIAVFNWRQCGIKVTMDTLESTDWTRPKMDGLVSPLHSDSADDVDYESDLEEEEVETEDGPAGSDSSEGDPASDAELGPDGPLEEEGWD